MTEREMDDIRDLLVRVMSGAPEPHGWAEVELRASSVDASTQARHRNAVASATGATTGHDHLEMLDDAKEMHRGGGRRLALLLAIAAAVVVVVAGWLVTSRNDAVEIVPADPSISSKPSPSTDGPTSNTQASTTSPVVPSPLLAFPTAVPEAPYGPRPRLSIVTLVRRDGNQFDLPDGVLGEQRILDTASPGGGFYLILCCDPGPTLWRNGTPSAVSATRIQLAIRKDNTWVNVTVDDVGDTLSVSADEGNLGDRPIATFSVPGLIDAAATSDRLLVLVSGDDPHLLAHDEFPYRTFDETTLERLEVPFADQGPCSIVPVNDYFLVLYGTTDGTDRCIGDRAALIDGDSGDLINAMRLPGTSRQLNSGGEYVTIVTTDGRVIVGRFSVDDPSGLLPPNPSSEPRWTTLIRSDAVAASVGFS